MDLSILEAAPTNGAALTSALAAYNAEVQANGQTSAAIPLALDVFSKIKLCAVELDIPFRGWEL